MQTGKGCEMFIAIIFIFAQMLFMKMLRITFLSSILALLVFGVSSCKKITQDQLINGLWQVNNVSIDNSSTNYLETLPHYTDGNNCCAYKLDFERDNTVIAYYITYNNFEKIVAGNWEVTDYNEVYVKVDSFMDGTFKTTNPSPRHWKLSSDANHIKAYDGTAQDTAKTVIDMQKI